MSKRRSMSLVPSGIGQLTLYDYQKKIRTKDGIGNSSDLIDLIALSNIDGTGTADRITKDDTCSDTCMHVLAAYVTGFWKTVPNHT